MKYWKGLAALMLAAVMALGAAGTAFAGETGEGTYADVAGHWAEEEIRRVMDMSLMDGRTDASFAPNENLTRSDLVEALYRLAGKPAVNGENPYTDVEDSASYRDAVVWASVQGIAAGKSEGIFDPSGDVKRQEAAKILNLFAARQVNRETLTSREDVISAYPDAADVASWAREPMNWAVASGFITGDSSGVLAPKGTATRAQAAVILCRYMDDNSTGSAARDNSRNADGIGENELLVVSFGTSFNDNRVATIKAIEDAMEDAFPDYDVRRGFTSDIIIEHIFRRDGQEIDSVKEALDRAVSNGVKNLLVQPTHLMNGYEYGDLRNLLEKKYGDKFESIRIGAPLLTTEDDFTRVAAAMVESTANAVQDGKTAVCWMGHGTSASSNSVYSKMKTVLDDAGHSNHFIGTVESEPTAADLVKLVTEAGYEKVILRPMMIVAGDHANNDMAGGDDPDSWYSVFSAAGLEVDCQINGLGEIEAIRQLLADHARAAEALDETAIESQPNPENPDNAELDALADGTYAIEVEYEGMFKVDHCELTVKDGQMTAALTLGSTSFDRMFTGTAAGAALAQEGVVEGVKTAGGDMVTFTLPVEALDKELAYAAHSVKKDAWYDRVLTFVSATAVAK